MNPLPTGIATIQIGNRIHVLDKKEYAKYQLNQWWNKAIKTINEL